MRTMKSKTFWLSSSLRSLLVAPLALLLLAPLAAHATGGGDDCDDLECMSFFAPEVIQNPAESPFFRSYRIYYQHAYDVEADELRNTASTNLDEWFTYFGGSLKRGTLQWLINKMPSGELANLSSVISGTPAPLSPNGQTIAKLFQAYGQNTKVLNALAYLEMAKRAEPIANRRSGDGQWDPDEPKKHLSEDTKTADELIAASPGLLKKADPFISARVRFQVIRLYFYTTRYAQAQSYFLANRALVTSSSMRWRFLETAAGAYYKDKQYGMANYLYSLVFGNFPSEKKTAYFSFHPMEQADWNQSLDLAKTTREKTVLWQLLGIYADGMAAIDQILSLDPQSDLLPLLLVREVNKAEEDWSTNRLQGQYGDPNPPKPDRDAVGVERLARLKAIADGGQVSKPYLWKLAVGHLEALAGDETLARQYLLASANGMPNNGVIRGQARASLLLASVRALTGVSQAAEPMLARELTWLGAYSKNAANFRAANLDQWLLTELGTIYAQGGDNVRSLMLHDRNSDLTYRDPNAVNAILTFRARATSAFDTFLVRNYDYSASQLRQLQALASLYKGDLAAAAAYLKQAGGTAENSPVYANTFTGRIVDCHDCEIQAKPVSTVAKLVAKLTALTAQANGTGEEAAKASLLLGNAYYNISYYGNSRAVYDTPHDNLKDDLYEGRKDSMITLNQDLANRYYDRAAALSKNEELRAQATFLAAKTEQNRWYNTHDQDDGSDIHPGKYYQLLKSTFTDTQYFKEVIRECGYFRTWFEK